MSTFPLESMWRFSTRVDRDDSCSWKLCCARHADSPHTQRRRQSRFERGCDIFLLHPTLLLAVLVTRLWAAAAVASAQSHA